MSYSHRKDILQKSARKVYDIVPLTITEFEKMKKEQSSIVNLALNEGKILFQNE